MDVVFAFGVLRVGVQRVGRAHEYISLLKFTIFTLLLAPMRHDVARENM